MRFTIAAFAQDERGEDLIEYGLLAAFAGTIAFAVLITDPLSLGTGLRNAFNRARSALTNA